MSERSLSLCLLYSQLAGLRTNIADFRWREIETREFKIKDRLSIKQKKWNKQQEILSFKNNMMRRDRY
jgi:hypothetical protein